MNSLTDLALDSPTFPADSVPWSLRSIVSDSKSGLEGVSVETLRKALQPVLEGLRMINADDLLSLEQVQQGEGPRLNSK